MRASQLEFASRWTWCLRCESVWPTIEWVENDWQCPTYGCGGGFNDMWRWDADSAIVRETPEYPEIPEVGEQYPL